MLKTSGGGAQTASLFLQNPFSIQYINALSTLLRPLISKWHRLMNIMIFFLYFLLSLSTKIFENPIFWGFLEFFYTKVEKGWIFFQIIKCKIIFSKFSNIIRAGKFKFPLNLINLIIRQKFSCKEMKQNSLSSQHSDAILYNAVD